jgi:hypothetical protein
MRKHLTLKILTVVGLYLWRRKTKAGMFKNNVVKH